MSTHSAGSGAAQGRGPTAWRGWRRSAVVAGALALPLAAGIAGPVSAAAAGNSAASVAGQLQAVTCTSGQQCWAVGTQGRTNAITGAGFIEQWDGASWQVVPSQNPPKSGDSTLDGVACAQVSNCWAVGYYSNAKETETLPYAEHWNGKAWSEVALPYPAHETLKVNLMRAVSCPAANLCFADGGGYHQVGQGQYSISLIERWNGSSWQIMPSPVLRHSTTTDLQGLSCASTSDCWATGDWLNQPSPVGPPQRGGALGYQWNGQQWTVARIQNAKYSNAGDLDTVSCPAVGTCMAVGALNLTPAKPKWRPYIQQWNGSSWATAASGSTRGTNPGGVSCTTAQMCMAVGTNMFTEQWNGSSWVAVPIPNPTGATGGNLYGVTCTQATNCWAVGDWVNGNGPQNALTEQWNGNAWTVVGS